MEANKLLVVLRIRGEVKVRETVEDTLDMLRLYHKNYCSLVYATPSSIGMITKVKDYVTFGEADEAIVVELLQKRGKITADKALTEAHVKMTFKEMAQLLISGKKSLKDFEGVRPFFRLQPPRGGFERAGIKHNFAEGGALGYRKDKINGLVRKML